MQYKALHKPVYKLYAYARTQECLDAHRQHHEERVRLWQAHKAEGLSDEACQRLSGISRASYYRSKAALAALAQGATPPSKARKRQNKRRWGEAEKQLVLAIRRANPAYGKEKIAVIIKRDHGRAISVSTVGRILKHLAEKGLIQRSPSALRAKRKRTFKGRHAKPWTYKDYKDIAIGERVQIDHMTVTRNGLVCKHFQAWDRRSKFIHAQVYSNAKSSSAKRFLKEFIEKAPFTIKSIQVDGGSEFMADFEDACAELEIPLIILPPKKPKYNGGVERGNRTFHEAFYFQPNLLADTIGAMRYELKNAVTKYNAYRPHRALNGLTPLAYLHTALNEPSPESQAA
jgi:transposase InsO family protein